MPTEAPPLIPAPRTLRLLNLTALLWAALIPILFAAAPALLDPDMFHEMALAREILTTGHIPLQDHFAYTPTISPVIHHEWGTGILLYFIATRAGLTGIYLLMLALAAAILAICTEVARLRGAAWPAIVACMPITGPLGIVAYGAVRAQLLTSLLMASALLLLELDRRGNRKWIIIWLPLYTLWVNLHGGFLVGLGILALHCLEQSIRTRRLQPHLLLTLIATLALSTLSPYGYHALTSAITDSLTPRPLILEWQPLWTDPIRTAAFIVSLAPLLYALRTTRPTRAPGLPLLAICALLCIRHDRLVGLYAVAWLCYVPAWFSATPACQWFITSWNRHAAPILPLAILFLLLLALTGQFKIVMPVRPAQAMGVDTLYPVGPVNYLRKTNFHGNLMTPFETGAFISWQLAPNVKVSIDGRLEVAYPPTLLPQIINLYKAKPGWQQTLTRYPTDLILTRNTAPIAPHLTQDAHWHLIYQDDIYSLYARPGLNLPTEIHTHQPLTPTFP